MAGDALTPIVEEGRNCWRIVRADRAAVIVDAADYYRFISAAMARAEKRIFIVGWDFDTRIALDPDENGKGETLGEFFIRLAREKPERQIDVLKWSFGALKQFVRPRAALWLYRWWRTRAIDFRFDHSHPPGCSHHQKIVVIDDNLAACGGIDISSRRWDTSEHLDDDPRRTGPTGKPYGPWHDATMMMQGPVAVALGELGRERWKVATGARIDPVPPCEGEWPEGLEAVFQKVDVAIARTRARYEVVDEVREVESLTMDMIAAARKFLYIENQYFTSAKIAAAISKRLAEPDPPEFVLVMPRVADSWLEQKAMDAARLELARTIKRSDPKGRFRIYVPVTRGGEDIYVHAKVAIVDDRLLRVGSANLNNRSQGLDSECDVIIDAALSANRDTGPAMTALRHRLMSEHLGCSEADVAAAEKAGGSLIAAVEALRGEGKTLDPLELDRPGEVEKFIADNELLDPVEPQEIFEPLARRGLARSWTRGREMIGERLRRQRGIRTAP